MNFSAEVLPLILLIPQIHSNFDRKLILWIIHSALLNSVSSQPQKHALESRGAANVTVVDVSWYVKEIALSAHGQSFWASMWAGSPTESLLCFKIPWSVVPNKFTKFLETPGPYPGIPGATTFDDRVLDVLIHLINQPVGYVWSTSGK